MKVSSTFSSESFPALALLFRAVARSVYVCTYMSTCVRKDVRNMFLCTDVRICGGETPTLLPSSVTIYPMCWAAVLVNLGISHSDKLDGRGTPAVLFSPSPSTGITHVGYHIWLYTWDPNSGFHVPEENIFPTESSLQLLWPLLSWFSYKVWKRTQVHCIWHGYRCCGVSEVKESTV